MIVDVRGTNTRNKGAQLMLEAICLRLGGEVEISVTPWTTKRAVRDRLGVRQTLRHPGLPKATAQLGSLVPTRIRLAQGWTADHEIGGVLDASGFLYSDQLMAVIARSEAIAGRAWARRGVPKVVLPQAFGPFERPAMRRWSREALEQAELVFVRDRVSENHIRKLHISTTTVRSPDFTIGLKPAVVERISNNPFLAVVPNTKLFTHGGLNRAQYVEILANFSAAAEAIGLTTVVVVHEETDRGLARQVANRIGADLFIDPDPLVLKGVLGQATAAIASRFHAAVGGLSQSVPTAAFGWSHKYRELLDDFGVPERLITPEADPKAVIADLTSGSAATARQNERLPALIDKVETMWDRTFDALMSGRPHGGALR
ncbi:polysaccharide pyruvyl transferase family protein [Mycolicibacterium sp. XJ2546]